MKALSLFTGIGGLDLSAEQAGYEVVGMVERDKDCQRHLKEEWPNVPLWSDIRDFNAKEFKKQTGLDRPDIIIGGPPCQPFSSAGMGKGSGDERDMWPEFIRVVSDLRPRWFFAENVEGLVNKQHVPYYTKILWRSSLVGYNIGWALVGADAACNAPQGRCRIFTIGFRNDTLGDTEAVRRQWHSPETFFRLATKGTSMPMGNTGHPNNEGRRCIENEGIGRIEERSEECNIASSRCTPLELDKFPPGPGLGGAGVINKLRKLFRRSPEQAWRAYQRELANTLKWREILRERPELAPQETAN